MDLGTLANIAQVVSIVPLVCAVVLLYRHHTCHVSRCWWLGRHNVEGTGYKTCRKHHPMIPTRGDITARRIVDAYHEHRNVHSPHATRPGRRR